MLANTLSYYVDWYRIVIGVSDIQAPVHDGVDPEIDRIAPGWKTAGGNVQYLKLIEKKQQAAVSRLECFVPICEGIVIDIGRVDCDKSPVGDIPTIVIV